ncbi:restriction endonuclease subunit S [Geoalkalibacter sp.]|uniref:restriction endonuclease subunit S n=1 Tax=Geoalkalibacter sp. TaxID=3041440 RepID=UPI00272E7ACD|nr:restriction endonuclease subunit S [Geoalkalibacter sp.]
METTTLGDLISLQRGYDLTERQRRPGCIPVVGSAGIHGYHDTSRAKGPGITLGRSGASFGKVTYVRQDFWPHNTTIFVTDFKGNDPLFVRYLLESLDFSSLNSGSAQQSLNRNFVYPVRVPKVAFPIQQRVAGILSAYDGLIENSQRRIKVLESMARALYREWFVNFRFPGHESVPRLPSPLGEIPQGWEVKKLSELVTTQYGYTESTNESPVGPKYLRGMDMNKTSYIDWSQVPYCPISDEAKEKYAVRRGDVFVIRMADPGKVGIVEQEVDAVFASYLIRVAPKDNRLSSYFLFYLMESAEYYAYITGASTGTTRKSASAGVVTDYKFILPPHDLIEQFDRSVGEIRLLLTNLLRQSVNLRRTRDLLLPRLLSGQIDIEEH